MLQFFRKYQKFFFIITTVVIVISFSFFGTYSTIDSSRRSDSVSFTAVDGSSIYQSEVDAMIRFLSSDIDDKRIYRGAWGPNFLNDGVIVREVLETGIGALLIEQFGDQLADDLERRHAKEKLFQPYVHPKAPFVSAENAWGYFAPDLKRGLDSLRSRKQDDIQGAFEDRVQLFLAERKFPASSLRQMMAYQQNQYDWLPQDPSLNSRDLSLFGYHSLDDWFGNRFLTLACQAIINFSKIAEGKGYRVTKEEALASLWHNADISFQDNRHSPALGVTNIEDYFGEQLRLLHMDSAKAAHVWQQVMLTRRLFNDIRDSVFVDPMMYEKFLSKAKEYVELDTFSVPAALKITQFHDLQILETYLAAVATGRNDLLDLPSTFRSTEQVKKGFPELVERRFLIRFKAATKDSVLSRVGVKQAWRWQLEDANWETIRKDYPALGATDSKEERFERLESLSQADRMLIDRKARQSIADLHPEWIDEALETANSLTQIIRIKARNASVVGLEGITDSHALLATLESGSGLDKVTQDGEHFYQIEVLDADEDEHIMTLKDAKEDGTVNALLEKTLRAAYDKLVKQKSAKVQNEDGELLSFDAARADIAQTLFEKNLKAIEDDVIASFSLESRPSLSGNNQIAQYRLFRTLTQIRNKIAEGADPSLMTQGDTSSAEGLPPIDLEGQWKLESGTKEIVRARPEQGLEDAFNLGAGAWSNVSNVSGSLSFYYVNRKGVHATNLLVDRKMDEAQQMLGREAQQLVAKELIQQIAESKSIQVQMTQEDRG